MRTWGISGPQFLLLYVALFAVTVIGVVLARRRVLAAGHGAAIPARLDPYEAAELNGGSDLVVTTAASNLLRRGSLTISRRRRGQPARLAAGPAPDAAAHPVEWALYQQVAASPDRRLKDLRADLEQATALAAVRERLRRGGLAPTPEQQASYRRMGLWFLPLLALGAARVVAGSANGRPVGFLVLFLLVTLVVAAALVLRVPNATKLGRRTLEWLRAEHPRPTVGASPAELSMATGLFGTGVLWDEPGRRRDRVAAGAGRVPGPAPGAGVRRGGGREPPRRPAAAVRAGGAAAAGGAGRPPRGQAVAGLGRRARPGAGRAPGRLAERLEAPLVSEHVAFVRAGGVEAGHLLPVPRTREALDVLTGNVALAQAELGVPLALEHVAALLEWPAPELDEAAFLTELLDRTGALLLLNLANLYANARNHGGDPLAFLDALPLERIAYVHVAGGIEHDGLYHDTHAHPTPPAVLDLVAELCARRDPPGVMLERDDDYPPEAELAAELAAIAAATGVPR